MGGVARYRKGQGDRICEGLMEGRSLRAICAEEGMPSRRTVFDWLLHEPEFRRQYGVARQVQADTLGDEALEIADGAMEEKETRETVARSKLRIDTRKWLVGNLAPKKYKAEEDGETEEVDPIQALYDEIRAGRRRGAEG